MEKELSIKKTCKITNNQKNIAALLGTSRRNVTKHLNKKFKSGELSKDKNTKNPKNTTNSCIPLINPKSTKQPILYNFEAILAVAFSVNSKLALEVLRWINGVLREYIVHFPIHF